MSLGPSPKAGTTIRFRPDPTIFPLIAFEPAVIAERLQTLAWLTPRLAISWQGDRLIGTRGLAGLAEHLCVGLCEAQLALRCVAEPAAEIHSPDAVAVDVALAWRGDGEPIVRGFVDMTVTPKGTHVDGMWAGLTALASRIAEAPLAADRVHARLAPGLVAIVRVTLPEPHFAGSTKAKLDSASAGEAVERALASADISLPVRRFLLSRLM